jgi:Flp pilus assembly protein TadG
MQSRTYDIWQAARARSSRFGSRLRDDEKGFTAVEFAIVAMPFLMLLFGTITVGLYFFVTFSLENAVEQGARLIRTGQAQTSNPPMTTTQFKTVVCNNAPSFIDCVGKLRVNVVSASAFSSLSAPGCTDTSGNLVPDAAESNVPGAAGDAVLVTVCYEWTLAGSLPFLKLGKMANGAALIQAATTFRTEPYN